MRYVALVILMVLLIALVVKKFNVKNYTYLECLFFTQCFIVISTLISFIVFIFIKFW